MIINKQDKKGDIPLTLTWFFAFLIILFIMFLFLLFTLAATGGKFFKILGGDGQNVIHDPQKKSGTLEAQEEFLLILNSPVIIGNDVKTFKDWSLEYVSADSSSQKKIKDGLEDFIEMKTKDEAKYAFKLQSNGEGFFIQDSTQRIIDAGTYEEQANYKLSLNAANSFVFVVDSKEVVLSFYYVEE